MGNDIGEGKRVGTPAATAAGAVPYIDGPIAPRGDASADRSYERRGELLDIENGVVPQFGNPVLLAKAGGSRRGKPKAKPAKADAPAKGKTNRKPAPAAKAKAKPAAPARMEAVTIFDSPPEVCKAGKASPLHPEYSIQERICTARKMLLEKKPKPLMCNDAVNRCYCVDKGKKKENVCVKTPSDVICNNTLLIASMKLSDGSIEIIEVEKPSKADMKGNSGDDCATAKVTSKEHKEYNVTFCGQGNGVNSDVRVETPPGYVVIGINRAVPIGLPSRTENHWAWYVPYSPALAKEFPDLIEDGAKYLDNLITDAAVELRSKKYASHAFQGKNVADVINHRALAILFLIEHFPSEEVPDSRVWEELEKILILYGANKGQAFQFSKSKAGAIGIGQLIPCTYKGLQGFGPSVLTKSFEDASRNHFESTKASFMLLDDDLNMVMRKLAKMGRDVEAFIADQAHFNEWFSADFNMGGPLSKLWEASGRLSGLTDEARKYIVKFNQVWNCAEARPFLPMNYPIVGGRQATGQ
jgi:hypothetical protein